jgi:putative transposase
MCEVLGVSKSGYYHWRQFLKDSIKTATLDKEIKGIFEQSNQTYGSPRVCKALQKKGVEVSERKVARRMQALKISPKVKKKFKHTTDSRHQMPIAPNVLKREFERTETGRAWVSDITYIQVGQKFVYLTTVIDLADRMVVGWSVSDNMTDKDTVIAAFKNAIRNRPIKDGLIFHSDRGSQYASTDFRKLLKQYRCIQSMSRKGNCWDNAVAESFFKTIKIESLDRYKFNTIEEVYSIVFSYIEGWYNSMRIHTSLQGRSPKEMFLYLHSDLNPAELAN